MRWALLSLVLGYLVIWFSPQLDRFLLGGAVFTILLFLTYISWTRLERLPSWSSRLNTLGIIVVSTLILTYLSYYIISEEMIDPLYYPPLIALMVLLRRPLKRIIGFSLREPKSFGVPSETQNGEMVRSKAEKQVADWLYDHNIEYEYEKSMTFSDGSIMTDFYLPRYDIYIEYWGMASANNDAGEQYRARKQEKLELYDRHGLKLISLYPHHLYELDSFIPAEIDRLGGRSFWSRLFGFGRSSRKKIEDSESPSEADPQSIFCSNCGESGIPDTFCTGCGQKIPAE